MARAIVAPNIAKPAHHDPHVSHSHSQRVVVEYQPYFFAMFRAKCVRYISSQRPCIALTIFMLCLQISAPLARSHPRQPKTGQHFSVAALAGDGRVRRAHGGIGECCASSADGAFSVPQTGALSSRSSHGCVFWIYFFAACFRSILFKQTALLPDERVFSLFVFG